MIGRYLFCHSRFRVLQRAARCRAHRPVRGAIGRSQRSSRARQRNPVAHTVPTTARHSSRTQARNSRPRSSRPAVPEGRKGHGAAAAAPRRPTHRAAPRPDRRGRPDQRCGKRPRPMNQGSLGAGPREQPHPERIEPNHTELQAFHRRMRENHHQRGDQRHQEVRPRVQRGRRVMPRSRSRTTPPPMPVITPTTQIPKMSSRRCTPIIAPEAANAPMPTRSRIVRSTSLQA